MVEGAWHALASGEYYADILLTLQNVAPRAASSPLHSAFSAASCCTGCRGCAGRSTRCSPATTPCRLSCSIPLFIVLFGLNRWPLVAIGFLFAVVAMMLNTLNGLDRVPRGVVQHRARDAAHPDAGNCADHAARLRALTSSPA